MSLTFFAENNAGVRELWVTDGTLAGSHMVRAFSAGSIVGIVMVGARAYFDVDDGLHGRELWVSDGTPAGTTLVADINPGVNASNPAVLTAANGSLFFAANDGTHGYELWKTDGTAAGTVMLKDINPGNNPSFPENLANVNGTIFFGADDGTHGVELWKTDGTAAGTVMVKDINPAASSSNPVMLTNANGTLFFVADDGTHGLELWKSDGTDSGTALVKDIWSGAPDGINTSAGMVNVNGTVFFTANDGVHGFELWKSDGTTAGTVMVKDINPGPGFSNPSSMVNINGTVFFSADDGVHGSELWKSDGTAAGTALVMDIDPGFSGSLPINLTNVNGTLFFAADDGTHGYELWKSDGTSAGTVMVKDIIPGSAGSGPNGLTNVNGVLEFYAQDSSFTNALFRSDGTDAGTVEIATNVDIGTQIGFVAQFAVNDLNGDGFSDILWRNSSGRIDDWEMNGGAITSRVFATSDGSVVAPASSWTVAGISDFNGDSHADLLWRNSDGTLADWTMNGNVITSGDPLNFGGVAVKPDASWSVAGTGDFDGDGNADILWRNSDGTLIDWSMNGSAILSSGTLTSGGVAVKPDASWSVAGVGDFDGDSRRDVLWRSVSGETAMWRMNGATISSSADTTFAGVVIEPGASWSVAGVGDFNADGHADILWRNADGTLAQWLMNGSTITSSNSITFNGSAVMPSASWHVVEVGDFNGDGASDVLWRNDSGALAAWLMNGNVITQSVTLTSNGSAVSPDASWSTQARPTIG